MPTIVLLVEDDPLMSDLYTTILTVEKFQVEQVKRSVLAVEKAEELHPGIIVLDLMMPEINGIEVLKRLKENRKTKAIPVIMFSNLFDKTIVDQALALGASRYAFKSDYLPRAFAELVKEVLAEKKPKAA